VISTKTVRQVASRLCEHVLQDPTASVAVVLHGGEPLLAGKSLIQETVQELREVVADLNISLQTNGVLLDDRWLDLLLSENVKVAVSLDGPRRAHDRHRRTAKGSGSFDRVSAALTALSTPRYSAIYAGLLCVVDVRNDPIETYNALAFYQPPIIDLLLPHGTWMHPPPFLSNTAESTPYADWLIAIFEYWYASKLPQPRVRLFESLVRVLIGQPSLSRTLGLNKADVLTVEVDGSIEGSDTLRIADESVFRTDLSVFSSSLKNALTILESQSSGLALSSECLQCPVVSACGGGLPSHRFSTASGFNNPSVYCKDLYALITRVSSIVQEQIVSSSSR
jgi:uncharacterized protein